MEAVRAVVGLNRLAKKYSADALDSACETALAHGTHYLRTIRQLVKRAAGQQQQQIDFIEHHPIICPLSGDRSLHKFERNVNHEHGSS